MTESNGDKFIDDLIDEITKQRIENNERQFDSCFLILGKEPFNKLQYWSKHHKIWGTNAVDTTKDGHLDEGVMFDGLTVVPDLESDDRITVVPTGSIKTDYMWRKA